MKTNFWRLLSGTGLLALLSVVAIHCGSVEVGNLDSDDFSNAQTSSTNCASNPSTFSADVVPVFSSGGCSNSGCHQGAAPGGSLNLDSSSLSTDQLHSQATSAARVNTSDPAASKMLRKPLGLDSHGGGKRFSSTNDSSYVALFCWIEAGAANN